MFKYDMNKQASYKYLFALLKSKGVDLEISGCGCCSSPEWKIKINEEEFSDGDSSFSSFEELLPKKFYTFDENGDRVLRNEE